MDAAAPAKRLRLFFLYDRRLLGALSRCAWRTVRDLYRAGLRDRRAVPGMVVSIQTYGDQAANWQPHLHALVTAGVVDGAGVFTPLPLPPAAVAEELFRRRVIAMLRQRGRLEDEASSPAHGGGQPLQPAPTADATLGKIQSPILSFFVPRGDGMGSTPSPGSICCKVAR